MHWKWWMWMCSTIYFFSRCAFFLSHLLVLIAFQFLGSFLFLYDWLKRILHNVHFTVYRASQLGWIMLIFDFLLSSGYIITSAGEYSISNGMRVCVCVNGKIVLCAWRFFSSYFVRFVFISPLCGGLFEYIVCYCSSIFLHYVIQFRLFEEHWLFANRHWAVVHSVHFRFFAFYFLLVCVHSAYFMPFRPVPSHVPFPII